MNSQTLISTLQQVEALVRDCLKELGRKPARGKSPVEAPRASGARVVMTLPGHILKLRDGGFFKEPRTAKEIHAKLGSSYHCDLNRVAVALVRLMERKQLRKAWKRIGDKKQVAYVW